MTALIGGTLAVDEAGCVHVVNGKHKSDVVWPAGYTADYLSGKILAIRNAEGQVVLQEGDKFQVGGGAIHTTKDLSCRASTNPEVFYINEDLKAR